jgi:hypothetical protein
MCVVSAGQNCIDQLLHCNKQSKWNLSRDRKTNRETNSVNFDI